MVGGVGMICENTNIKRGAVFTVGLWVDWANNLVSQVFSDLFWEVNN